MEELDRNAGDIFCDLIDVQEKVLVELQSELLGCSEITLQLTELCGELDCLIAFATVSSQRRYTRPEFLSQNEEIEISGAFHPLFNTRQNIVPNNINVFVKFVAKFIRKFPRILQ